MGIAARLGRPSLSARPILRRALRASWFTLFHRDHALGGVDSRDSRITGSMIQDCFLEGSLGCDGSFGVERRGLGAAGTADHRSTGPEGLDWTRQPDVRGGRALDCAHGLSLA